MDRRTSTKWAQTARRTMEKERSKLQVQGPAHLRVPTQTPLSLPHRCYRNPNFKISNFQKFPLFKPQTNPLFSRVFPKNKFIEMRSRRFVKKRRVVNTSPMAEKDTEIIEIVDSCPSPDQKGTPLRPIFCLKNRDEIKKFEETEECFILEFDPYNDLDINKLSVNKDVDNADADLSVLAEKGQVACRDYPHPRHTCAKHPFEKTPHDHHCELCYCYVCDLSAPCLKWTGTAGHCHAFNNEAWNSQKEANRRSTKTI